MFKAFAVQGVTDLWNNGIGVPPVANSAVPAAAAVAIRLGLSAVWTNTVDALRRYVEWELLRTGFWGFGWCDGTAESAS